MEDQIHVLLPICGPQIDGDYEKSDIDITKQKIKEGKSGKDIMVQGID